MAPPRMLNLRVIVGVPGTDQGNAPPLIRNVPGPVPFTISADWVGSREGGVWELVVAAQYDDGAPIRLLDGGNWATQFAYKQDFSEERFTHEDLTVLALIERGGVLHFRRQVAGEVVGEAELAVEVEAEN